MECSLEKPTFAIVKDTPRKVTKDGIFDSLHVFGTVNILLHLKSILNTSLLGDCEEAGV